MPTSVVTQTPTLYFTPQAWERLQCYLRLADIEISGLGRVLPCPGGFLVDRVYLLQQEVTPVTTDMQGASIALFIDQLIRAGEEITNIRLWWHSHVNIGLQWSPTDNATMRELAQDFFFGLVGSKKGEVKVRMDIASPSLTIDSIPVDVRYQNGSFFKRAEEELAAKVRILQVVQTEVLVGWGELHGDGLPMTLDEIFGPEVFEVGPGRLLATAGHRFAQQTHVSNNGHRRRRNR